MAKIRRAANPTFRSKIDIPTPDGDLSIEFEFRHKSKPDLEAFREGAPGREDLDIVMEIASGWSEEDPFSREEVEALLKDRHMAAHAIVAGYIVALTQGRLGN